MAGAEQVSDQMVRGTFDWTVFGPLALDVPLLRVDTTQGYAPKLETIIAFRHGSSLAPSQRSLPAPVQIALQRHFGFGAYQHRWAGRPGWAERVDEALPEPL